MDALLPTAVNAIHVALDAGTSGAWAVAVHVRGFVRPTSHVCSQNRIEARPLSVCAPWLRSFGQRRKGRGI